MALQRQIIGFGGGLLDPYKNRALEKYVLDAAGVQIPKVCFIGTASGDETTYRARFFETFAPFDSTLSCLPLFAPAPQDIRKFLLAQDVIFVGGGNTRTMLAVWREWEIDAILREAWEAGVVLAGESAGMLCWFMHGLVGSVVETVSTLPGLGILPFSACPHYSSEPKRRPAFQIAIENKRIGEGFGIEDGAGIHFIDQEMHTVIADNNDVSAYRVSVQDGKIREEKLTATVLEPLVMRSYNFKQKFINLKYRLRGWNREF